MEMMKSNALEKKVHCCTRYFEPEILRRKINDGRRKRRNAPATHPWRQYKISRHALKS